MDGGAIGAGALAATGVGAAVSDEPQLAQKASPAGFGAPQLGQLTVPEAVGAGAAAVATAGAAALRGSPHSSQNADPSGFSCPCEQRIDMILPSSNPWRGGDAWAPPGYSSGYSSSRCVSLRVLLPMALT
ncbi:MAG TPA: hypothetical protein VGR57_06185 [Ktedonobacterales bacterium]|nr:hypothetical protein [Ktedonobacterales bacterium]